MGALYYLVGVGIDAGRFLLVAGLVDDCEPLVRTFVDVSTRGCIIVSYVL